MPSAAPLSYGVLLFPGFEVLDMAGPLECLNMLAKQPQGHNLTLAVIGSPIDEVLYSIPAEITPSHPSSVNQAFQSQQIYKPTHTFFTAPPLDVLILPGGRGARPIERPDEIAFIKKVYPTLQYLFTICNGVSMVAASGILDNHQATSNKALWKDVTATSQKTHWIAKARWVVSGNIWSSSGVSAGTDAMLAFISHVYSEGEHPGLVQKIANSMEYMQVKNSTNDPFAEIFGAEDVLPQER